MKNILLVANYSPDVGYAWWLMEKLWSRIQYFSQRAGSNVFISYPKIDGETVFADQNGIVPIELDFNDASKVNDICAFLLENEIGVIYLSDWPYYDKRYSRFKAAGVEKIIVHDHTPGDREPVKGLKRALKLLRNQREKRTADYIVSISPLMRARALGSACVPEKKCFVVQNGIPPIAIREETRKKIREVLGIDSNVCVIVTSGRLHPYKNVDFTILAYAHLLRKLALAAPETHLLILGDGPQRCSLEKLVSTLGLEHDITFVGFTNNAKDYLQAADIAIHSSKGEGFSLSILEYMSAQLPVVVPSTPSVCQVVDEGKTGLVFEEASEESAANSLYELVLAPIRRKSMGGAAKQACDQDYSLENCLAAFDEFLCEKVFGL